MNQSLAIRLLSRGNARPTLATDVALVLAGSTLIALLAQLAVPTLPVPITGQTLGVLLVAAALGSKRGVAAVAAYLAQGALGLPVFAGGAFGLARLAGPTGGYLVGFLAAAYIVGRLCETGLDRRARSAWVPMLLGQIAIWTLGTAWLANYVGLAQAVNLGVAPFVIGDLIKIGVASVLLPVAWRSTQHFCQQ